MTEISIVRREKESDFFEKSDFLLLGRGCCGDNEENDKGDGGNEGDGRK